MVLAGVATQHVCDDLQEAARDEMWAVVGVLGGLAGGCRDPACVRTVPHMEQPGEEVRRYVLGLRLRVQGEVSTGMLRDYQNTFPPSMYTHIHFGTHEWRVEGETEE